MHKPGAWSAAVAIVALCGVTAIEIVALLQGIDGTALAASMATIGGLGGWYAKKTWGGGPSGKATTPAAASAENEAGPVP